uniref:Si:ch211-214c7.5 n=1 Tax=Lates calcarifer TaxID=8187 RepID=A0A4W6FML9_LATCA
GMERSLQSMQLQLQFFMSKADDLHDCLVNGDALLLDFSQQLCDRLEQLVLTYASHSLLCLDETEPNSVSHFCIGQSQLGRLRLTAFRYCKPTPFLARVDVGLYKRMRWNVERLRDEQQHQEQADGDYFLCYEDIPNAHAGATGRQMWSIGQWVQVNPDPETEDIYNWYTYLQDPHYYHKLLFLGSEEPSSCSATDYLQQLLLSHQTAE